VGSAARIAAGWMIKKARKQIAFGCVVKYMDIKRDQTMALTAE
jgi:hypothetical protein